MRILVTNDDGIDAPGLTALAAAIDDLGELVVVAPLTEYSGAGASIGPLHLNMPRVHDAELPGVRTSMVAAVEGPPSLAVILAGMGAFGPAPELVVSGINPGLNVGWYVYHSGTVGATLTARNAMVHGIAVSQEVARQPPDPDHDYSTAAAVARAAVQAMLKAPPAEASVLNLNVPNLPLEKVKGIKAAELGTPTGRREARARLEPEVDGTHLVVLEGPGDETETGDQGPPWAPHHDGGVVSEGYVAMSWLGHIVHDDPGDHGVEDALSQFFD